MEIFDQISTHTSFGGRKVGNIVSSRDFNEPKIKKIEKLYEKGANKYSNLTRSEKKLTSKAMYSEINSEPTL